jgi:hypothetical protein
MSGEARSHRAARRAAELFAPRVIDGASGVVKPPGPKSERERRVPYWRNPSTFGTRI